MKRECFLISVCCFLLVSCTPRLGRSSDERVIAAMTREEKVRLLVGTCLDWPKPPMPSPSTIHRDKMPDGYDWQDFVSSVRMAGRVRGSAGQSYAIERLGIPAVVMVDGPVGMRIDTFATAFPSTTLMAATQDTDLVFRIGAAIGEEMVAVGADLLLAPGMNLMRNPLCGRNYEYMSSDPDWTAKIASAYVRGVQSQGVGACLKHFAANNQETFRNGIDVQMPDSLLRNHYLKAFEYVVRNADPWLIMSSYNRINGVFASENQYLLTDILRNEWGFKGFVVTDWWAEEDPVRMQKAGCDMQMPGTPQQIEQLLTALDNGTLDEKIIDRNVQHVLDVIKRTATFRGVSPTGQMNLEEHAALAREAASKGMVLLENRNATLPLKGPMTVALTGVGSYNVYVGGSGSGNVTRRYKVNLADALTEEGFLVDQSSFDSYRHYVKESLTAQPAENFWVVPTIAEKAISRTEWDRLARTTDICLLTIQRMAGEGADRSLTKGDYYLTDTEQDLIRNAVTAFHKENKKVVLLLNIGSSIHLTDIASLPDAVLLTWLPGQEAGHAIMDVLTGRQAPVGHLPMPFYYAYEDVPSAADFPWSDSNADIVIYREGTRQPTRTLYPLGYGLTY